MQRLQCLIAAMGMLATFAACKSSRSDLSVVNGSGLDANQFTETILLSVDSATDRICTGVVVSDNTALLASHCLKSRNGEQIAVSYGNTATAVVYNWLRLLDKSTLTKQAVTYDVAVAVFEGTPFSDRSKFRHAALAKRSPRPGEQVAFVGYGKTSLSEVGSIGAPARSAGTNTVGTIEPGQFHVTATNEDGNEDNALLAPGDSGGPVYLDGQLAGISAGIMAYDKLGRPARQLSSGTGGNASFTEDWTVARNAIADLNSAQSQRIMQFAVTKGAKIPGVRAGRVDFTQEELNIWLEPGYLPNSDATNDLVALCGGSGGGKFGNIGNIGNNFGNGQDAFANAGFNNPNANVGQSGLTGETARQQQGY